MKIVEANADRLVIEETGSGFGLVCVIAGHAIAFMPLAWRSLYWQTSAVEIAVGAAIAIWGALLLTKTRAVFDRRTGALSYSQKNVFRARFLDAQFNEVEDVMLQRGARDEVSFAQDARIEEKYSYRVVLRAQRQTWPLSRGYRELRAVQPVASGVRAVLDDWRERSMRTVEH